MLAALIICLVLLMLGRDELSAGWLWGIIAFLALSLLLVYHGNLHPIICTVPIALVDIVLVVKTFGGDINIR